MRRRARETANVRRGLQRASPDWAGRQRSAIAATRLSLRSARADEEGADGGAEGEPFGVALEAAPEAAAFGGLEGGVAFVGESGGAGLLVLEIGLGGGEL